MSFCRFLIATALLFVGACEVVTPSNPFDPAAPPEVQAPGTVSGSVAFEDAFDVDTSERQLLAVRVGLLDSNGRRLTRNDEVLALDLEAIDATLGTGTFSIDGLTPGAYSVAVDGVPSFYARPELPIVTVLAGGTAAVDPLRFVFVGNGDEGPGRITGDVRAEGGALGQVRASLFTRRSGETTLVKSVIGEGGFDFTNLAPGIYAVVVESDGFTSAYRLDLEVGETGTGSLVHSFTAENQIVVRPVTAVLLPQIPNDGVVVDADAVFLRRDDVPVAVLAFADDITEVGVTGMRLSASPAFVDAVGEPLPFSAYAAAATVAVPTVDGPVRIHAQFEARSPIGFVFTSPTFTLDLVRDTAPPVVVEATVLGVDQAADETWLAPTRQVTVRVDGTDATSGLAALRAGFDSTEEVVAARIAGQQRLQKDTTAAGDGPQDVTIVLVDRAGNESLPLALSVLVDTVAPAVDLVVEGAGDGFLRSRLVTLNVDSTIAGDDALLVAVGLEGAVDETDVGPPGPRTLQVPASVAHGAAVTFEAIVVDVVGNRTSVTRTVVLDLRGTMAGVVASDGLAVVGSVDGATATLIDGVGATVDQVVVNATGVFTFAGVPEGRNYSVRASFGGHSDVVVRNLAVDDDAAIDLGALTLPLLRGEVRGTARRSDVLSDPTAHAGIAVSLRLVSPAGRIFGDTAFTDPSGAFTVRDVPQTRPGEELRVDASAPDYGAASAVALLAGASVDVGDLQLPRARGDFDVCRSDDAACTPAQFVQGPTIDIRLRDATDVVALLVGRNGGAPVSIPLGAANRTALSIAAEPDGELVVTVQTEKADGSRSETLAATLVKDTVAPVSPGIVRTANPLALDPRFTAAGFVDVTVTADPGVGVVAPLAAARVLVDASPAIAPVSGFLACTAGESCRVQLPDNDERRYDVFAYACDAAGNCSAPVGAFVIRDVTPPALGNGATFDVRADGSVVDGGVTILPSPLYVGEIGLGHATTLGSVAVLDEDGNEVADVFGFRFSLSLTTLGRASIQTFADPAVADVTRNGADIAVPPLANVATEQTVFAQLVDAAGNISEAQFARVEVDTSAPDAVVVVNNGLPTSGTSVPFTVAVPPAGEAPRTIRFVVDNTAAQTFTLPLTGAERLVLPAVEGPRTVVIDAFDRVNNAARTVQTVLLDTSVPLVASARCVAITCVDGGFGQLTTTAANARVDLLVDGFDAVTAVASVRVTFVPPLPGADATQVFALPAGGRIDGVLVPAGVDSTMTLTPVDAVGNIGAGFVRAVRHDVTGPVIGSVVIEPDDAGVGAILTNKTTLAVAVNVAAGDATQMRLAASSSFSGAFVEFNARTTFTIAGADGPRQVCVEVKDVGGNTSFACDTVTLDRTPPAGSVTVASALTRAASIQASLTMPADTVRVAASANGTCAFIAASPPTDDLPVVLGDGDGPRTITACFEDGAGNRAEATTSLAVDRTPPTVAVSFPSAFATTATATATLQASADADSLAISVDAPLDCATASYGALTATTSVVLGADGVHLVRACVRDGALNTSLVPAQTTVVVDTTRPSATAFLNAGAAFTRSSIVTATVAASADTTLVALANAASLNCATATYTVFQPTLAHTLVAGDGPKSVSICVKDAAGLVSASSSLAQITVDTTAPTGSLVLAGGASTTSISPVNAAITSDADVVGIAVSASPAVQSCTQATASPSPTASVDLFPNINNVVTLCLVDGAGNFSAPITRTIFFENANGEELVIAIEGGAATTRRRTNVPVALFRPSTDFDQMKVVEAPTLDCSVGSGYVAFADTFSVLSLTAGVAPAEGTRTISACIRKSTDTAQTKAATDTIFVDTFRPAGSIIVSGAAVTSQTTVSAVLTNAFASEVVQIALSQTASVGGNGDCTGSFEAFASPKAFTFAGGDGDKDLFLCLRDAAGNTTEVTTRVTLDRTPPSPVIVSAPLLTTTQVVPVSLTFPVDAVQFAIGEGTLDCATAQGYAAVPGGASPSSNFTVSGVDGTKTIVGCFKDAAGNTSQATTTTTLDRTNPTGTVVLDGGATFSTDVTVSVAILNAADAVRMVRVESAGVVNCAVQSPYVAFVSPLDFTVSNADGTKTVQVCLEDAAGNRALAVSDTIVLDRTAPNGTLVIDDGAAATNSRSVTLAPGLGGNVDVVSFAAAEGSITCNAANLAYQPFASLAPFSLSSADGQKTVLLCLKDQAGNVSTTAAQDTIVLDTGAPVGVAVSITDGDGFLQAESSIGVTLSWTTNNDVAAAKLGEGGTDCQSTSGYVAVAGTSTTQTLAMSGGDGTKLVLACFKDAAGNIVTGQDTTLRDTALPTVTAVTCSDCVAAGSTIFTTDATVVLAVSADEAGSGLASARIAIDAGAEAPAALVNGTVTVAGLTAGVRTVRVRVVDRAGNVSAASRDLVVTFDNVAPTLAQVLINGSAAVDNATNNRVVGVSLLGVSADTVAMAVAEGNGGVPAIASCAAATYSPFVADFSRTVPAIDGDKTISVCLEDRAGNRSSSVVSTTIRLDGVGPSLAANPVAIQDGDGFLQAETTANVLLSWVTNNDARKAKIGEGIVDCSSVAGYVDLPTAANSTTINSVPFSAGDGSKTLGVCFKDAAGNTELAQDSTVRDNVSPTVTALTCNGCTQDGATVLSRSTTVSLAVSSDEAGSGVQDARISIDGGVDSTTAITNGVVTVAGLTEGTRSIRVKLRDRAQNTSSDAQGKIIAVVVDTTRPNLANGDLRLNGLSAGGATNNPLVTASLASVPADTVAMALVEAASAPSCAAATYVPLALTSGFTLSSGAQGLKTVFVCLRDRAGNTAATATAATVTFDTVAPSLVAVPVQIQDGDGFIQGEASVDVVLRWTTNGDVTAFKLGDGGVDCSSEPYETPAIAGVNTFTRTAFPISSVDGVKAVFVCFRDAAGNVATASDTSVRDQAGPSGSVVVDNAQAFTTDEDVSVSLRMEPGTARFALSETVNATCSAPTLNCATATYVAVSGATTVDGLLLQTVASNLNGTPAGQGAKCFEACFEDGAGNKTAAPALDGITFDSLRPTLATLTLNGGAAATRDRTITAVIAGASADAIQMALATTTGVGPAIADCATASYVVFAASSSLTLPATDGTKAASVCLKDVAGNVSVAATNASISLDGTPPQNAGVSINNGDVRTRLTAVSVSLALLAAEQATTQIQVATDGTPDTEPFEAFVATRAVTLPAGDGVKTVVVRFRDSAGNELVVSDSIDLDTAAPVGGAVIVNGGAVVTSNTSVTLTVTAPADATEMSVGGGAFVAVSTTVLAAIAAGDCTPGTLCKSVAVIFRDAAGNAGVAVADTIELDTAPPSGVSLALASTTGADASGFTTSGSVNGTFTFVTGAGQATQVKHGEGAVDCSTAAGYAALGGTSPAIVNNIALSNGDAQKTYVACFKDAAGNVSSTTAVVQVDRTRPFGVISINAGDAATTSESVSMGVIPASDDANRVAFVNAASAPDCAAVSAGSFGAVAPTMAHTLALGDGAKTVFACFKDTAGNVSTLPISDGIVLDKTAPTVAVAVVGNASAQSGLTNTLTVTATISSLLADTRDIAIAEGTLGCATASFEPVPVPVPATLVRSLVLANTGDGARTVSVCARDGAGNISGTNGVTAAITVDTTPPQVAVSIAAGATFTLTPAVTVSVTATPSNDPLKFVVGNDPSVDCALVADGAFSASFASLPATAALTLSSGDGEKLIGACFKDRGGNVARFGDAIILDTERPSAAAFAVDAGATFSLDTTVTADFTAVSADVVTMQVTRTAIADCGSATFTAFVNNSNVTALAEGNNTVFACLRDAAGNVSDANPAVAGAQPFTDTIRVDTTAPSWTAGTLIVVPDTGVAPDSTFTPTRSVTVRVDTASIAADVVAFAIDNTAINCATVSYTTLPQPLPVTLTLPFELTAGADGARVVAACIKDAAGLTNSQTRSITLDTTPPQVSTFSIDGGATVTKIPTVLVTQGSTPSNDSLRAAPLSTLTGTDCGRVTYSGGFSTLAASATGILQDDTGLDSVTRFLVGCYQDRAGNTAQAVDDILFDEDRPNFGSGRPVCTDCNLVDAVPSFAQTFGDAYLGYTNQASLVGFDVPVASADVDFVLAMATTDSDQASGTGVGDDRVCTVNANCNVVAGETCEDFPIKDNPQVIGKRCVLVSTPDAVAAPIIQSEGRNAVVIALEDTAGNLSNGRNVFVVRDTTVPAISYVLNASITSSSTVFVRSLDVNNEPVPPSAVSILGTFQASNLSTFADASLLDFTEIVAPFTLNDAIPVALSAGDGGKTVRVRLFDNAGNASAEVTAAVTLDATAPTTPQFAAAGVVTNALTFPITNLPVDSVDTNGLRAVRPYNLFIPAVATAATTCGAISSALINGNAGGECQWNGTTTVNVTLIEGENRIQVRGVDAAGNVGGSDVLVVTRDTAAPTPASALKVIERDGAVVVSWSPSTSSDVGGYRVYYGTIGSSQKTDLTGTFASEGASPLDIGNRLTATLSGLPNNSSVFIGVEAYDRTTAGSAQAECRAPAAPPFNCSVISTVIEVIPNVVTPVVLDTVSETFVSMAVQGTRAYGLRSGGGFAVYDVSEPSNIVSLSTVAAATVPEDGRMIPDGNFVYAIDEGLTSGLRPINVSNPLSPSVAAPTATGTANRFYIDAVFAGSRGYGVARTVVGGTASVATILKRSTATSSGSLTETEVVALSPSTEISPKRPTCIASDDRRVVIGYAESLNGVAGALEVLTRTGDVLTSASILSLDETAVSDVLIHGNKLIASVNTGNDAIGESGIHIYSLGNDTLTSTDIQAKFASVECKAIAAEGPFLYCAEGGSGPANRLVVIDIRSTPRIVGREVIGGGEASLLGSVGVADTSVFGLDSNNDIVSWELTDLSRARTSGALGSGFNAGEVRGRFAYAAGNLGTIPLTIFDVLNPESPLNVEELDLGAECPISRAGCGTPEMAVNGSLVAIANRAAGISASDKGHFMVVDAGNPSRDVAVLLGSSIVLDDLPTAVVVRRNAAFVLTGNRLRSFRIDTDGTPVVLDDEVVFGAGDQASNLVAQDGMLYSVSLTGVLKIINAANPASLTVLATSLTGVPAAALEIDGPFLFAGTSSSSSSLANAVRIVDISTNGGSNVVNPVPAFETGTLTRPVASIARAGSSFVSGIGFISGSGNFADGAFAFKPRADMAAISVGLENRSVSAPTTLRVAGPFAYGFSASGGMQILEYQR